MKRILITLIALFSAASLYAADTETNRSSSMMAITAYPVSVVPAYIASVPTVAAGMYFGESWYVGLESGSNSYEDTQTVTDYNIPQTTTVSTFSGSIAQQGLKTRWYAGNSWNFFLGVHQRTFTTTSSDTQTIQGLGTYTTSTTMSINDTVASVGTGNEWIFDFGMVLGIEWLVASAPISTSDSITLEQNLDPNIDTTQITNAMQKQLEVVRLIQNAPGVLNIYVGYAF